MKAREFIQQIENTLADIHEITGANDADIDAVLKSGDMWLGSVQSNVIGVYNDDNTEILIEIICEEVKRKNDADKCRDCKFNNNGFNSDKQIAIIWSIEDVQSYRPDLNDEQAMEVLRFAEAKHDADFGVTWDVIIFWANELYPETEEEDNE